MFSILSTLDHSMLSYRSVYLCTMLWLLLINLSLVLCDITDSSPKLVIDNDAGGDDAMAIFLALLYEKHYNGPKLIGLTTGNGNTNEDNVCINNQRVLKIINRQDVPIYRGSKSSLVTTPPVDDYYGKDGLGDSGKYLDNLKPAHDKDAVDALIELSKEHKDQLTVVTLGALTNVARAIKMDPEFLSRIAHLYVGAGHVHDNSWPEAEFNAHMDVEAYHVVASHATPERVTFVPFSQVQQHCNYSLEWRKDVLGAIPTDIVRAQNLFERVSLAAQDSWQALDPAAVAVAVNPSLVDEYKFSKHDIVTSGKSRGITTNEFLDKENANARIIYSYKTDKYKQFLLDIFKLE